MKKQLIFSICILLFANHLLVGQNLQRGLIAHYLFNGDVKDVSGNKNDGIQNGGLKFDTDRFGSPCGALHFNGIDGYIVVPDSRSIKSPRKEITITVWLKLNQGAGPIKWSTVLCKSDIKDELPESPQYRFQTTNQTVSINTDFTENFVKDLAYDQWYHYTLTYNGAKVKTFLNGKKFAEFPYTTAFVANNMPLEIGRDMPGALEYFSGSFDDLRIFNRGLSEKEINNIYQDKSEKTSAKPCDVTATIPPPPPPPSTKKPPTITLTNPTGSPTTSTSDKIGITATIKNIAKAQQITFEINGQLSKTFSFDPQQAQFKSTIPLTEGFNVCKITATNQDGTAEEMTMIQYNKPPVVTPPPRTPQPPLITLTQPTSNPEEVTDNIQVIKAEIKNIFDKSGINFKVNGKGIRSFSFNKRKNAFESKVKLEKGNNFFEITATNQDGQASKSGILIYQTVSQPPRITILTPAKNPYTTKKSTQKIKAKIHYVSQKSGIEFAINGQKVDDFSFNTKSQLLEANIDLNEGFNVFQITASNQDGTSQKVGQIQFEPQTVVVPTPPTTNIPEVNEIKIKEDIVISDQRIELICFDHQREDGDTVSIFINNQLIADKIGLTTNKDKAFKYHLNLELDKEYLIVSKAWNLGTRPPNTMTIDIYGGTRLLKRVQLESEIGKSEAIRLKYR